MSFAAGTFFIVLDCLSHTYTNPHSVFLRTDPAGQLVLDLGLWFLIFFLEHVSQEFTPKICDTAFEIVSVFTMSMPSLILCESKGKHLALATRDSFSNFSSSSCGCVGSTIELPQSKSIKTTWQINGAFHFIKQCLHSYVLCCWNVLCSLRLSQSHVYKPTLSISMYWPSWSLILASDSWSFSCSTYRRNSLQKYLTQFLKSWACFQRARQSLLLFKSKGNVSPWPLETLSPTFPPAPVVVLVRRSNFHNQNPSRPHGKSMELFTLSSNVFIPMSFAAGTFFVVLECLRLS